MGPELEARLLTHFPNASIELIDESHLHAGHEKKKSAKKKRGKN